MGAAIGPDDAPRLVLAECHPILRHALKTLLQYEGFRIVGEASNGWEAVEQCARLRPEVAVLDLSLPVLNGIDAARAIAEASPGTRLVLLSSYTDARIVLACARAGVRGFVSTANATKDLGRAILAVHQGGTYVGGREIPPC